jgi:predicted transcriptional regulator
MIDNQQERFRKALGAALTDARKRLNISIPQLSKSSGEQHKTIVSIESGNVCSMHHILWMREILGIDINKVIKDSEGIQYEQKAKKFRTIDDFI